jgi:hypothetical protein
MHCSVCGRDIRGSAKVYEAEGRMLCESCYIYRIRERIQPPLEGELPPFSAVKCPKCGTTIREASWRCRECYSEFENYDFEGGRFDGEPRIRKREDEPGETPAEAS